MTLVRAKELDKMFNPLRGRKAVGKDRRADPRKQVSIPVQLSIGGCNMAALLEDLNPGGTRVRLGVELQPGQPVYVKFPAGISRATCRWSRTDSMEWVSGLEFSKDPALEWELNSKG